MHHLKKTGEIKDLHQNTTLYQCKIKKLGNVSPETVMRIKNKTDNEEALLHNTPSFK